MKPLAEVEPIILTQINLLYLTLSIIARLPPYLFCNPTRITNGKYKASPYYSENKIWLLEQTKERPIEALKKQQKNSLQNWNNEIYRLEQR